MHPSPASIGIAMIGFSLIGPAMAFRTGGTPLTLVSSFAALPLLLAGVAMFVRRREALYVGLAGPVILVVSAIAGMVLRRDVGLPLSPALALVMGLYATFRVFMARDSFGPVRPRHSIADQLAAELAEDDELAATRRFVRKARAEPPEAHEAHEAHEALVTAAPTAPSEPTAPSDVTAAPPPDKPAA